MHDRHVAGVLALAAVAGLLLAGPGGAAAPADDASLADLVDRAERRTAAVAELAAEAGDAPPERIAGVGLGLGVGLLAGGALLAVRGSGGR